MSETVKEKKQEKPAKEKKQKKSWFKGLKAEFNKVVWPSRKSLARETVAVVVVSVLLGVIISIVDFVARIGIEFLVK
ncbi:MAG: preprotein translocase subunit SecE [Lachnospira sp.]|nr:preprotein translocase subunit SecE [Lachnospira sp.]